jgi:hypothetical protein
LRWPPSEALSADVNAILIAYEGDVKRLNAIAGADAAARPAPLDLRAFARAHNAARAAQIPPE